MKLIPHDEYTDERIKAIVLAACLNAKQILLCTFDKIVYFSEGYRVGFYVMLMDDTPITCHIEYGDARHHSDSVLQDIIMMRVFRTIEMEAQMLAVIWETVGE